MELTGQLMPGADPDLVRPLEKRLKARYEQILLNTKVTGCTAKPEGLAVDFEDANGKRTDVFDRVLVAVGRSANGKRIGLENADIDVSDRGIIPVDKQMRTNLPHVFAIGDLVPGPMLAHKAMHEAKVAAEVAALGERLDLHEVGLLAPRFNFGEAVEYKIRLDQNRDQQSAMVKAGRAAVCTSEWRISGSLAEGKKVTGQILKLMLRAFNGECDALVAKVRYDNATSFSERMRNN